jgi:hypothetical protein
MTLTVRGITCTNAEQSLERCRGWSLRTGIRAITMVTSMRSCARPAPRLLHIIVLRGPKGRIFVFKRNRDKRNRD